MVDADFFMGNRIFLVDHVFQLYNFLFLKNPTFSNVPPDLEKLWLEEGTPLG